MDRIPNKVVKVLRLEQERFERRQRIQVTPLSWIPARLCDFPGAIESLASQLNGRYFATYRGPHGSAETCCGGHRQAGAPYSCVSRKYKKLIDVMARVPGVGLFRVTGHRWECIDNYLSDYNHREQMKTIDDLRGGDNPFRPARRVA